MRDLSLKPEKVLGLAVELQLLAASSNAPQRAVGIVLESVNDEGVLGSRDGSIPFMEEESRAETCCVGRERIPRQLDQVERDMDLLRTYRNAPERL